MALQEQTLNINFAQGLDTKSDPFQVPPGKFLALENSVFTKAGLLQKRNGFGELAELPDTTSTFLTTFNGNLTAVGNFLQAYSDSTDSWVNKGTMKPLLLNTLPLVRSNTNQSQVDSVVAPNGLVCTVFTDNITSGSTTVPSYKYVIANKDTGQNIVAPTVIPVASGAVTGSPRVFLLNNYFVIVFVNLITAVSHLQYVAISTLSPTTITANTTISNSHTPATTLAYDGFVANNNLYLAWNGADVGDAVRISYLQSTLAQSNTIAYAGELGQIFSVTADITGSTPTVYVSYYKSAGTTLRILAVDHQLNAVLAPTTVSTTAAMVNVTSTAQNGVAKVFFEVPNTYLYDVAISTNLINMRTVTVAGVVGSSTPVVRSVGLASKAFLIEGVSYLLSIYNSLYQPTYFLLDETGKVASKLAYSNGGVYYTVGLPNVTLMDNQAYIGYFFKDLVQAVARNQDSTDSTPSVYSQTGINLAKFTVGTSNLVTSEIGNDLHLSGGFLWMYDGYSLVEHGFHLYPDYVEVTGHTTGGTMLASTYFYQVTYEWSDNQGNIFRSAPSLPVTVTTTGSTSSVDVFIPTLRLTYKTANPVKLVIYRWSAANPVYYQVTSITVPTLNNTTIDYIGYLDTLPDSSIIGNNILYTTGGVLENIEPPASDVMTLFQSRLFTVSSEDRNTMFFSKQVIASTPVEMSDLLSIYVAPTTSAHGSTGPISALSAMDDKLIIFKENAIYYITGNGPDNTGANNQFSEPTFITSTVGSMNQQSIVFIPQGLMFQSNKGIWLLGRDLSSSYIGSPVEAYNNDRVLSAVNIPGTNQVRFTLESGATLMYDYFYGQWGTFKNIPSIASTIYEDLHTYVNVYGQVFQETPGVYLDGSRPVLMGFTTGWLNLAGVQGLQRFYSMYLLGKYYTPFKLNVQLAYNYNPSPQQSVIVTPDNYAPAYGLLPLWGSGGTYGGPGNVFEARVFPSIQKVESFQVIVSESFDSTYDTTAGAGLTLSGLNLLVGLKKNARNSKASRNFG